MSFDVFFQEFRDGDVTGDGEEAMRTVLRPYVVSEDPTTEFMELRWESETADVYFDEGSMMATRVAGMKLWDVLVQGAEAANWTVIPVGCAPCLTREGQREHLPEDLAEEAVLVTSGPELLHVIETAE